jgi:energy-coupling factor transporter ATP-binding protein EcfA2
MAEAILVIGESGSGKSTSLRNLDSNETIVMRVVKKPLPFRGWKSKYSTVDKDGKSKNLIDLNMENPKTVSKKIIDILNYISNELPSVKNIIIDDAQYIMSMEFMARSKEGGWGKFTEIAEHFLSIVKEAPQLRDDLFVVLLAHSDNVDDGDKKVKKLKTIGNLLNEKITVEGLFTYVLYATIKITGKDTKEHVFVTQSDGTTVAKTPMGMFDSVEIDNDLQYVINSIKEYNGE